MAGPDLGITLLFRPTFREVLLAVPGLRYCALDVLPQLRQRKLGTDVDRYGEVLGEEADRLVQLLQVSTVEPATYNDAGLSGEPEQQQLPAGEQTFGKRDVRAAAEPGESFGQNRLHPRGDPAQRQWAVLGYRHSFKR